MPIKQTPRRSKYDLTMTSLLKPDWSVQDARCLDYYRTRVSSTILGYFEERIWNSLILKASHTEPVIQHAIVALSSIHEGNDHLALRHYNRAIQTMRTVMAEPVIVLMSCLIFIWIENLQDNNSRASTHIQSGLRIVAQNNLQGQAGVQLAHFFRRLYAQGVLLESPAPVVILTTLSDSASDIQLYFDDVNEAQDYLHGVISETYQQLETSPYSVSAINAGIDRLRAWRSCFEGLIMTPCSEAVEFSLCELEIEYLLAWIAFNTISAPQTTIYDRHTRHFKRMLKLSEKLLLIRAPKSSSPAPFTLPLIAPLFFTIIKCRIAHLRETALRLAQHCPLRESSWERDALIAFALWKKRTEERLAGSTIIPENSYIYGEKLRVEDGLVIVSYKRRAQLVEIITEEATDLPLRTLEMAKLLGG